MKRRRKNQKREKMIMLCSSVFVLTALTMTGLYVKDKNQVQDDGYVVDLSQLEPQTTESYVETKEEDDSAEVSSGKVKNQDRLLEEENSYDFARDYAFMEEMGNDDIQSDISDLFVPEEELKFSETDSLLWPIVGNVLINYSMETPVYFATLEQYKCNPAIIIQAKEGQNVMAAADGIVSKIEKTEELGTVVTMDVGDGYEIVYGQLTNLQVKEGDRVNKSDYIADVAAPTKYYVVEGTNIYFALRKDGEPKNPMMQME